MKGFKRYVVLLFIASLFLSCGDDDAPPNAQELAFERLEGTWELSNGGSIMINNQNASLNFPGFSLSFTDGQYNTANAGNLFNATGTWEWLDTEAQSISLDDGKTITIIELTETVFEFSFQFDGSRGVAFGNNSVSGAYVIRVLK